MLIIAVMVSGCGGSASEPAQEVPEVAAPVVAEPVVEPAPVQESASVGAAVSGQRTFVIVPEESKASYIATEEFFADALTKFGIKAGFAEAVGSTQAIEGQLELNLDDLSAALGENTFTVQMNTLVSDRNMRDNWIRENGPRFNDYPTATFKATAIEGAPGAYTEGSDVSFKLIGDLTVRDVTQTVTFDVTASLSGDTLTGVATASALLLSEFGIEPPSFANTLTVADEFGIEVQFTAREP
jgi:polyisoprenoid-binding protein YceI